MTDYLGNMAPGQEFVFAFHVTSTALRNTVTDMYGPGQILAGHVTFAQSGTITGTLANPASNTPVVAVQGFVPVGIGDVVENNATGETKVCRWAGIAADGYSVWSASAGHQVVYPGDGWTVIGTAALAPAGAKAGLATGTGTSFDSAPA